MSKFERNEGFISRIEQNILKESHVIVAGAGGDGGHLALSLARLGIGEFTLADPEIFEEENINRQAEANRSTIGRNKALVLGEAIMRINPEAKVRVFEKGVTESNLQEIMSSDSVQGLKKPDLMLDETDYEYPELGLMIARACREHQIPDMMGLNVGYGARFIGFHPEQKETFESWLGLDEAVTLEEMREHPRNIPISRWIGRLPKYANMNIFREFQGGDRATPSVIQGVLMAAAITSTQAQEYLLSKEQPARAKNLIWAPRMMVSDAKEVRTINPKSKITFALSGLRAIVRTRQGKNPPY